MRGKSNKRENLSCQADLVKKIRLQGEQLRSETVLAYIELAGVDSDEVSSAVAYIAKVDEGEAPIATFIEFRDEDGVIIGKSVTISGWPLKCELD